MKSFPRFATLATSLVVAATLAACGGADSSYDSSDSASSLAAAPQERSKSLGAGDPAGWDYCTWEGGTCTFSGTRQVRFGTSTASVTKTFTGSVLCSNAAFGDPAYGKSKSCWLPSATTSQKPAATTPVTTTPATTTPATTATSWTNCTWQGGTCTVSGTRQVRYGAGNSWVVKTVTGSIACTDAIWGDPIYGTAKTCQVATTTTTPAVTLPSITVPVVTTPSTTQPVTSAPTYGRTQMFALANPNITVQAGQDINLRVRFYGVRLPEQSKVFTHFYAMNNNNYYVSDLMHHYQWVPTQSWNGYVEYDYPVNVPISTPPGTYRIGSGIHQGVSPYVGRMDTVDCNGLTRLSSNYAASIQTCHVGTVTVLPPTMAASRATDGPMNMFYTVGRSWNPLSL